jgi:ABC-type glutathione transport system ATPase component
MWRSSAGNLLQHTKLSSKKQRQKHFYYLKDLKLLFKYPMGGQKQRVMIAMAIACKPLL